MSLRISICPYRYGLRRDVISVRLRLPHQVRGLRRSSCLDKSVTLRSADVPKGTICTCPMHPKIRQIGPE